tara:strand:+ start:96 stop:455 length:360 start_codon:yes stop_codon:yes gene_type:complete
MEVKTVTTDNLHSTILDFIKSGEIIIGEYDDMKDCILKMIRAYYVFNMDRDRLRDAMEDITYMLCPNDDINKDRVSRGLEYEYSSDEEEEEEEEEQTTQSMDTSDIEEIGDISGDSIVQ